MDENKIKPYQVVNVLIKYGFNPKDKEVEAITEVINDTKLGISEKYDVLNTYGKEALIGMINHAVELANLEEEDPETLPEQLPEQFPTMDTNTYLENGPEEDLKCPKCRRTNIRDWRDKPGGDYRYECLSCEDVFN